MMEIITQIIVGALTIYCVGVTLLLLGGLVKQIADYSYDE